MKQRQHENIIGNVASPVVTPLWLAAYLLAVLVVGVALGALLYRFQIGGTGEVGRLLPMLIIGELIVYLATLVVPGERIVPPGRAIIGVAFGLVVRACMAFLTASAIRLNQPALGAAEAFLVVYAAYWLLALLQILLIVFYLWLVRGALETDRLKPPAKRAQAQAREEAQRDEAIEEQRRQRLLSALLENGSAAEGTKKQPASAAVPVNDIGYEPLTPEVILSGVQPEPLPAPHEAATGQQVHEPPLPALEVLPEFISGSVSNEVEAQAAEESVVEAEPQFLAPEAFAEPPTLEDQTPPSDTETEPARPPSPDLLQPTLEMTNEESEEELKTEGTVAFTPVEVSSLPPAEDTLLPELGPTDREPAPELEPAALETTPELEADTTAPAPELEAATFEPAPELEPALDLPELPAAEETVRMALQPVAGLVSGVVTEAGLPLLATYLPSEPDAKVAAEVLATALAAVSVARAGDLESVVGLAGDHTWGLTVAPGACGIGYVLADLPAANLGQAMLALKQYRQALAQVELPQSAFSVSIPVAASAVTDNLPAVAQQVLTHEGPLQAFAGQELVLVRPALADPGVVAVAAEALLAAFRQLDAGISRLLLTGSSGGLVVDYLAPGVVMAMVATASNEVSAYNVRLKKLKQALDANPGREG